MDKLPTNEFFVKRLGILLSEQNIPRKLAARATYLATICSVTPQAARKWLKGDVIPDNEKLLQISKRLNTLVSYLLGEIDIKNFSSTDNSELIKNSMKRGSLTIDINESMFFGSIVSGDAVICTPESKVTVDGAIYVLQSSNNRYFRRLSHDKELGRLTAKYEDKGVEKSDVIDDQAMIDIYLSSLIGRVEAVIRKI